MSSLVYLNLS
uniref:Uncharacterized protein n=1 Tax=Arundo donax TaxID=35708 RepID=A0A0A9FRR6_ARUDO